MVAFRTLPGLVPLWTLSQSLLLLAFLGVFMVFLSSKQSLPLLGKLFSMTSTWLAPVPNSCCHNGVAKGTYSFTFSKRPSYRKCSPGSYSQTL